MAKLGFGGCAKRQAHEFMSLLTDRECSTYQQAPAEKVEQRKKWAA